MGNANSAGAQETRFMLRTNLYREKTPSNATGDTHRASSAPLEQVSGLQETEEQEDARMREEFNKRQARKKGLNYRNRRRSVTVQMRQSRRHSTRLHENLVKLNILTNIREVYDGLDEENNNIGEGTWGKVKLVTAKHGNGPQRAVKILQLSNNMDENRQRELKTEITMLQEIDHPHIAKLYEIYEEEGLNLYLVQEYLAGGELFDRVIELGYFQESKAADAVRQMVGAVQYLHNRGIVHRDLKLENFMYRSHNSDQLVLIDFGLSTKYHPDSSSSIANSNSGKKTGMSLGLTIQRRKKKKEKLDIYLNEMVGSSYYMAPEVLRKKYGQECDLWSIGVITYMLLSGHPPFSGDTDRIIMKKVAKGVYDFNHSAFRRVSHEAKDFVVQLLQYNPQNRMSAREALEHPWLAEFIEHERRNSMRRGSIDRSVVQNLTNFVHTNRFKKLALQAVAYSTRYDDIKNLQEIFEEIDQDQDGYITLNELQAALKDNPWIESENIEKVFDAMDIDGSQKVHLNEFLAATLNNSILRDENILIEAFRRLDVNESGEIDRNNLADLLGQNFDRRQVDMMLREFSLENGGSSRKNKIVITRNQFIQAMRKVRKEETAEFMSDPHFNMDDMLDDPEIEDLNI